MADQRYEVREVEVFPHADGNTGMFTVADDEQILTSEYRGSNRLIIAVLTPTTVDRCLATTGEGTRCKRDALSDSNYCGLESHGDGE